MSKTSYIHKSNKLVKTIFFLHEGHFSKDILDCYHRYNAKLKENHTVRRSFSDVENRSVRVSIPWDSVPPRTRKPSEKSFLRIFGHANVWIQPPRSNMYSGKRPNPMNFRRILEAVFQPELFRIFSTISNRFLPESTGSW